MDFVSEMERFKPRIRPLFCLIMGLVGLTCHATAVRSQEESVFRFVQDCDILAAHPDDPQRMADGIGDDQIVPRLAILACEDAIDLDPEEPRFAFQLGRALLAVGQQDDAFALFQTASGADYAAAWAYLGDAHQFGLGTPVDGQQAYQAYQKALDLGFLAAEGQIAQLTFDGALYARPFVQLFFEGQYPRITGAVADPAAGAPSRNYVFSLVQTLLLECEPFLQPGNVPALYGFRYPANWTPSDDEPIEIAIETSVAEYDAAVFLRRHGCSGLIAQHMFDSFNRYLAQGSWED